MLRMSGLMRWPSAVVGLVLCLLVFAATRADERSAENASETQQVATAKPEVAERLTHDLKFLASDALEGRGVGTDGLNKAADFVKSEFEKAGLDVTRVEGVAYQKFSMVTGSELGEHNELALVAPDGRRIELKRGSDFEVCSFGGSGQLSAPVVFCGYGIEDKESGYDDFADVDLKGKVAVIMRRVPQQENPQSPFAGLHGGMSRHAELRTKVSNAYGKGAVGILFVNDPHTVSQQAEKLVDTATQRVVEAATKLAKTDAGTDGEAEVRDKLTSAVGKLEQARKAAGNGGGDQLMPFGYGGNGNDASIPIAHLTVKSLDEILKAAMEKRLRDLETEIDSDLKPRTQELEGWQLVGEITVNRIEADIQNVIGVLEGEGALADETIVIGAHYDHVGMGGENSLARGVKAVHNGADDNGSGTVSLIELARRLASRPEKLKRRLVFIAFTAEELGLIGSARYVKEPVFPLEQTVAMFNMDMVGRLSNNELTVFGSGTAPRWDGMLQSLGQKYGFELSLKPEGFGPSDHSSFYGKKIPVLHFFTGTHGDYHRPTDDWEKVNFEGMQRIIGLIEEAVVATANESERPKYVAISRPAQVMRSGNRPYFGSIPDFGGNEPGYGISGVSPGSPADKGGLKGGDRIVKFGADKIGSLDDFDLALRKFKPGDTVDVVVTRDGKEVKLEVKLDKPR